MRVLNTPAPSEAATSESSEAARSKTPAASSDAVTLDDNDDDDDDDDDMATHMEWDKHRVGWPRLLPLECRGQSRFEAATAHPDETGQVDELVAAVAAAADITRRHGVRLCRVEYGEQVVRDPLLRLECIPVFRVVADGWGVNVALDWREALFELAGALVRLGLDRGSTPLHVEIVHRGMPYGWCMRNWW